MGTRQLLLITLSIVIVGIAVAIGFSMFNEQAKTAHRNMIISRMTNFVVEALQHRKIMQANTGEATYVGYKPMGAVDSGHVAGNSPGGVKLETDQVNYFIEWYFNDKLKIIASSKVYGEGNYWQNDYNARIIAVFDNKGEVDEDGFQIMGNW
jgi:hypothetical protein